MSGAGDTGCRSVFAVLFISNSESEGERQEMPYYLHAFTSLDRENLRYNIVVAWDDDPNHLVCQTDAGSIPSGHQFDPDKRYITDKEIDDCLALMGFEVVGRETVGWGERIVKRANSDHSFFDPATREWYSTDPQRAEREAGR